MSRELELYSYVTLITPFSPMVEVTVRYILIVAASLLTFIATLSSSFILATNMYLLKMETKYITDKELKKKCLLKSSQYLESEVCNVVNSQV